MMTLFNTSKPNTGAGAKAIKKLMSGENSGAPVLAYKPPEGAKINVTDPEKVTRMIKKAAIWFGADEVGICRLDRRWVYSHTVEGQQGMSYSSKLANVESKPQEIPERFQYAVVMGYEMDYGLIRYFPTYDSNAATSMGYSKMAITNNYLSAFIRNLGFKAIDCSTNDVALSIPMAMQAGLGDLARNGLLITPKSGPRVRLSKVITDLPLVADAPIDFGVMEFCAACQICADRCPSQSIIHGERTVKPHNISNVGGVLKWPVDAEKCRMYWARGNKPCVACIAVCPYNKRDTLFHRLVRWFTDHIRWADPFYVKMDNLFGYGKARQPDNFWEEWQPRRH
jgi:reductive dehalogenase